MDRPFVRIKHRDAIDLIQKLVKEKVRPREVSFVRYYMPIAMRTYEDFFISTMF